MQATSPLPRVLGVVLLGASRKLSMKQARSGAVLIGGGKRGWGDLRTRDRGTTVENVRLGAVDAAAVLPVLAGIETTRTWVGLEGLTPDEMPIIDRLDDGRAYVAAGFCGHGFAIGPVVGRLLSEWLLDGRPSLDLSAFRRDRFPAAA
jgi:sarcosine oxidase subunit beta